MIRRAALLLVLLAFLAQGIPASAQAPPLIIQGQYVACSQQEGGAFDGAITFYYALVADDFFGFCPNCLPAAFITFNSIDSNLSFGVLAVARTGARTPNRVELLDGSLLFLNGGSLFQEFGTFRGEFRGLNQSLLGTCLGPIPPFSTIFDLIIDVQGQTQRVTGIYNPVF